MPATVPPGFVRGPLLFLPGAVQPAPDLIQLIWHEAGAYGARLLLVAVEETLAEPLAALAATLDGWGCDGVQAGVVAGRTVAQDPALVQAAALATGIVLMGDDPLRLTTTLGGTPLAQAIRRANAHSKVVAGIGGAAALLCQHMPAGAAPVQGALRQMAGFAPGLGLINRLLVDGGGADAPLANPMRLAGAVALNPFLIGVGLGAAAAAVVYQDNTLQAYGVGGVTVVDGAALGDVALDAPLDALPAGLVVHRLAAGATFHLDTRRVQPPLPDDLDAHAGPIRSAF